MSGSLKVRWGDRLEVMADRLFDEWEASPDKDPFSRICIVVGDLATRNWLQRHFLLHRKPGARRILANIDFKPLAEFVNDWLSAETHGRNGAHRRPAEHPYAKGVLAWRINAMLKTEAKNPDLAVPQKYIARANSRVADRRRFELATRLAELFDDYLENRYQMLANWEAGKMPSGEERWQAVLYRLLVSETPDTYTRDYASALSADADPSVAFSNGFPRYTAIHVFDVAAAPWPYLLMLQKISKAIPTTFWTFNPSRAYWLDDPDLKTAKRESVRNLLEALQKGETPPEPKPENSFETPDARLLGALAGGTRGVLSAELDLTEGDCDWVGDENEETFASLAGIVPEVHVCHSPRRELEAVRDALHRFFDETPDARPSDAIVLCADWGTYSPLVESVFNTNGEGGIPFSLDGGVQEETPISHSLGALFEFRTNRFEVNAVFSLLGVPAIRDRFGIDADGLSVLREMVRNNNIHWGYDDADVNSMLGMESAHETRPFTWRRGLDRFIADALLGQRDNEDELIDVGRLGRLLPCGHVEAERARLVGALAKFVDTLAKLRTFLQAPHAIDEWRNGLLHAVDDFYLDVDSVSDELAGLRRAIVSATNDALIACSTGKSTSHSDPVPGDVMCTAILEAVKSGRRRVSSAGDAVRFAPLANGTAVPARFVWICGLNDGTFPRTERRASFDLIGRHPTLFDVTPRDKDTVALLKAALGARDRLSLSYIGRDIRSNEEVPAAVPLIDLIEWFKGTGRNIKTYRHPLQAYSPRYFTRGENLPPSYSAANHDAAVALLQDSPEDDDGLFSVIPFPLSESGKTVIDLDDLVAFYSRPNHFLASRRLDVRLSKPKYDILNDDDALETSIGMDFQDAILLGKKEFDDPAILAESERMVESGSAANADQASAALKSGLSDETIQEFQSRTIEFAKTSEEQRKLGCPGNPVAREIRAFEAAEPVSFSVELSVENNREAAVVGSLLPTVELVNGDGNPIQYSFVYKEKLWPSDWIAAWIRHLVRQTTGGGCATAVVSLEWKHVKVLCPVPADEAKKRLAEIVMLATKPMPVDLEKARGVDELPEELAAAADYSAFLKYKGQRSKRK